jgi:DNA ligase (NAD+)
MNIDGMGKSIVDRFYEEGWVRDIADVYQLDYEKVSQLEGFGEKSATNIEESIEKAKKNPIHRLLHSLTIHHLGKKVSKLLAQEINHVLDLQNWTEEDYTNIKDVGPKVAENVQIWFANERNIELLKRMEELGVNMLQTEADKPRVVAADAPLLGKTILFTGKLEKMSRKEAQMKAEAAGAKNISAVSSKLSILVAGEKAGSKLKKARALETVQILTEDEFIELVG